jgi:hypothetical protein
MGVEELPRFVKIAGTYCLCLTVNAVPLGGDVIEVLPTLVA